MKKILKALAISVTLAWALVYPITKRSENVLKEVAAALKDFPAEDQEVMWVESPAESLLSVTQDAQPNDVIQKIFTFSETMAKHGYELELASIIEPEVRNDAAYKKFSSFSALCVSPKKSKKNLGGGANFPTADVQENDPRFTFVRSILTNISPSLNTSLLQWMKDKLSQPTVSLEKFLQSRTIFQLIEKCISTNRLPSSGLFSEFEAISENLNQAYEKMKDEDKYVALFLAEKHGLLEFASSIDRLIQEYDFFDENNTVKKVRHLLFGNQEKKCLLSIMINFYTIKALASVKHQTDLQAIQEFIEAQLKKLVDFVKENEDLQDPLQNFFNKQIGFSFLKDFDESNEATVKALLAVLNAVPKVINRNHHSISPSGSSYVPVVRHLMQVLRTKEFEQHRQARICFEQIYEGNTFFYRNRYSVATNSVDSKKLRDALFYSELLRYFQHERSYFFTDKAEYDRLEELFSKESEKIENLAKNQFGDAFEDIKQKCIEEIKKEFTATAKFTYDWFSVSKPAQFQLQAEPTVSEIEKLLNSEPIKPGSGGSAGEKPSWWEQRSGLGKAAVVAVGAALVTSVGFALRRLYKSYQNKARIARAIAELKELRQTYTQEKIDEQTYLQRRNEILDAYAQSPEEREKIEQGAPA